MSGTAALSRWPLALAAMVFAAGTMVLALAVSSRTAAQRELPAPPGAPAAATPAASDAAPALIAERPAPAPRVRATAPVPRTVSPGWVAGFYPLYEEAQRAFGVSWLLIASVHGQETAFSTAAGTYRGLNFANCCAGPMQFNVTNGVGGIGSTWERYRDAHRRARRPAAYPHPTAGHPSVYDDFDAIMAGAALLADQGAGLALDGTAWQAAYDYYGHDLDGIAYADEVVARAIGWSQQGFGANAAVDPDLRAAVAAAWGAPARAALLGETDKPRR